MIDLLLQKKHQRANWLSFALRDFMKSSTEKIALCGILTALSVVVLFVASVSGIGTFAGPIIASLIFPIIVSEYDIRTALTVFISVSVLAVILMPDRELAAAYICFCWYPIIRGQLELHIPKMLSILFKLLVFSLSILAFSRLVIFITGIPFGEGELSKAVLKILFLAGVFTFLLLDFIYAKVVFLWETKLRNTLLRK